MRSLLLSFTLLLLAFGTARAAAGTGAFEAGNAAFELGDYLQAEREYRTAVDAGVTSPELFYNLAASQQELGQPVRAALNYRRALFLEPELVQAWRNLEALSESEGIPMPPFHWREEVNQVFPPRLLLFGGLGVAWLAAIAFVGLLLGRKPRPLLGAFTLSIAFVGVLLAAVGWMSDPLISSRNEAMVVAPDGAQILSDPFDSAEAVRRLAPGDTVFILRERGAWWFVRMEDDVKGWVDSERVEPIIPAPPETATET